MVLTLSGPDPSFALVNLVIKRPSHGCVIAFFLVVRLSGYHTADARRTFSSIGACLNGPLQFG